MCIRDRCCTGPSRTGRNRTEDVSTFGRHQGCYHRHQRPGRSDPWYLPQLDGPRPAGQNLKGQPAWSVPRTDPNRHHPCCKIAKQKDSVWSPFSLSRKQKIKFSSTFYKRWWGYGGKMCIRDRNSVIESTRRYLSALTISDQAPEKVPLIQGRVSAKGTEVY